MHIRLFVIEHQLAQETTIHKCLFFKYYLYLLLSFLLLA